MKEKIIICIAFLFVFAIVSAQSYIQVDRAYSGSGVDKKLTLTVRNLSNKDMAIYNHYPAPSCVNYKYLNSLGAVLYSNICETLGDKRLMVIPAKSSKSFIYHIGSAARYLSNNKGIKTIQLRFSIEYSIPELKFSDVFDTTVRVAF